MMLLFIGWGFILGIVLGSFAKAMADRSMHGASLTGRSHCPHCKHTLAWYDLIPLISFLIVQGKCRYCRKKIPLEYILVECLMGFLIAFLFARTFTPQFPLLSGFLLYETLLVLLLKVVIIVVLVITAITDLKETIIPDVITFPAIGIGFIILAVLTILQIVELHFNLSHDPLGKYLLPPASQYFYTHAQALAEPFFYSILSALGIGLFFLFLILITSGRGMGGGDLKLGIFLGLVFGFPNSLLVIILSFLTGSIAAIVLILARRKHFGQTIPFGPFLSLAGLITIYWADPILKLLRWA
jgi:prepilin signal peptidase PulO-like enzyme (type II secretory pathway)